MLRQAMRALRSEFDDMQQEREPERAAPGEDGDEDQAATERSPGLPNLTTCSSLQMLCIHTPTLATRRSLQDEMVT